MDPDARVPSRDECVVGDLLRRWARERPTTNFLEFEDGDAWTFAATLDRVQRAAGGLQALGVVQGSHVLCWLPNVREAVLTWLAANYLGAVHVPLNTATVATCCSMRSNCPMPASWWCTHPWRTAVA